MWVEMYSCSYSMLCISCVRSRLAAAADIYLQSTGIIIPLADAAATAAIAAAAAATTTSIA